MKNKLKKICTHRLFFGGLFLLLLCLLLPVTTKASNNDVVYGTGVSPYSGTITSGTYQTMVCVAHSLENTDTGINISWHGVPMTQFYSSNISAGGIFYFYLNNPDFGTYYITNTGGSTLNNIDCIVKENINQASPIVTTSTGIYADTYNYTALSTSTPYVVLDYTVSAVYNVNTSWSLVHQDFVSSSGATYYHGLYYSPDFTSSYSTISFSSGYTGNYFIELNTAPNGVPPCTAYTYTAWSQCLPVGGSYTQNRYITGTTPSTCDIYNIDTVPPLRSQSCDPSLLNITFPYDWQGILYNGGGGGVYEMFKYQYSTDNISSGDYIKMFSCTNSNCTGTITPMTFDNGHATTTDLNILHPFGITADTYASGTSMFIIPQPDNIGTTTQELYYRLYLYQGGTSDYTAIRPIKWLSEDDYNIKYPSSDTDIPPQTCTMPSYDISDICSGIDTLTVTGGLQCGLKYGFVVAGQFLFYPTCDSMNFITNSFNKWKHSFPYNTLFDLTNTIDSAINTSLATTTPQNFSIPFIRKTATSSQYYMLPVMSSSTISNTIGNDNYSTLRTTLGFIWWAIGSAIVFFILTKL